MLHQQGASLVFLLDSKDEKKNRLMLDWMLVRSQTAPANASPTQRNARSPLTALLQGFSAGVMIAASYWSLLAPGTTMSLTTPLAFDTLLTRAHWPRCYP
jgi:zinc transporter ZupT